MNKKDKASHFDKGNLLFGLVVYVVVATVLWGITLLIPLPDHVGSSLGLFGMSWFGLPNWLLVIWTFGWTCMYVAGNLMDLRGDNWNKDDFLSSVCFAVGILSGGAAACLVSWHVVHRPDFERAAYRGNLAEYRKMSTDYPIGATFEVTGIGEFQIGKYTASDHYALSGTGRYTGKVVIVPVTNVPKPVAPGTLVTIWVDPPKREVPWYHPQPTFFPVKK